MNPFYTPYPNGAIEITKPFLPIMACKDHNPFAPFFFSFSKGRKYPRFYQSMLEMSQWVQVPQYYYGFIDNCLIILKKRYIHTPVLKLMLPPISLNNDYKKEKYLIEQFRMIGIGVKLSEEDLEIYDYDLKTNNLIKEDTLNVEFIYNADDYAKMKGKKHKTNRNIINKFNKLLSDKKIEIGIFSSSDNIWYWMNKCNYLYHKWCHEKDKNYTLHSAHKVFRKFQNKPNVEVSFSYIMDMKTKQFIIFGINEQVGDKHVNIVSRFRRYDVDIVEDPTTVLHHWECKYWVDKLGDDVIMNYGSGVIPGLTKHKKKLKPIKEMQIYDAQPYKSIDKHKWDNSCLEAKSFGKLF